MKKHKLIHTSLAVKQQHQHAKMDILDKLKQELTQLKNDRIELNQSIREEIKINEQLQNEAIKLKMELNDERMRCNRQWAKLEMEFCEFPDDVSDDDKTEKSNPPPLGEETAAPKYGESHYVWWRVPVWYIDPKYNTWECALYDLPFIELLPCSNQMIKSLGYVYTPNQTMCFSDAVFLHCTGCIECVN